MHSFPMLFNFYTNDSIYQTQCSAFMFFTPPLALCMLSVRGELYDSFLRLCSIPQNSLMMTVYPSPRGWMFGSDSAAVNNLGHLPFSQEQVY